MSKDRPIYFQTHFALEKERLIIEVTGHSDTAADVRLDSESGEFKFRISDEHLKRLGVAIIRYLKGEGGIFYYDEFHEGPIGNHKVSSAEKIVEQYSL